MKQRLWYVGRQGGFTLIELMLVLAVAGVLLMLAAPSFTETIRSNRRSSLMRDFAAGLMTTRSEAVKTPTSRIVMCVSTNGTSCTGGTWEQGWVVFRDDNANQGLDGVEPVLLFTPAFPEGYTLRSTAGTYVGWFSFRSTGDVQGDGGSGTDVFQLCGPDKDSAKAKYLRISAFGQASYVTTPQTACP